MIAITKNDIPLLQFSNLSGFGELFHFTTTREGGESQDNYHSFNLGFHSGDIPECVSRNRMVLNKALEINQDQVIFPKQTHSAAIKTINADFLDIDKNGRELFLSETDALITNCKGICIGIKTADCVPLLLFDQKKQVIAAIHAGWRGTAQSIAFIAVNRMIFEFNSDPKDIIAGIGPSISPEVYEVGREVWSQFDPPYYRSNGSDSKDKRLLNLWEANRDQLIMAGIPAEQIELAGLCTFSNREAFFSARRDGIKTGRMASGIMLMT